jgi:hypothetical protein
MKLALDRWYELWEAAGSRGLDTWHEPPGEKTTYPRRPKAGTPHGGSLNGPSEGVEPPGPGRRSPLVG